MGNHPLIFLDTVIEVMSITYDLEGLLAKYDLVFRELKGFPLSRGVDHRIQLKEK